MMNRLLLVGAVLLSVSAACSPPADASCQEGFSECSGVCVDTRADDANCGACGVTCDPDQVCAGSCIVPLLGTGTAADPYHSTSTPGSCLGYVQLGTTPPPTDGVYVTHPAAADVGVYCDMTHGGVTYESFGTGQYNASYPGWTFVGSADFQGSRQFDAAFSYLYNRGGLVNLQPGFASTFCGIIDTVTTRCYGLGSGNVIMSLSSAGTRYCNPGGGYTLASYKLAVAPDTTTFTERTSFTAAEVATVGTTACNPSGNPAIFVKRYQ